MTTARGWILTLLVFLPGILLALPGEKGFASFFAKFKAAVEQEDEKALTAMMAPSFAFFQAENVTPAEVFRALDADDGQQWQNLQQAIQNQPTIYNTGKTATAARVLQCTPTEQIYNCLVIFTHDSHLGWRWKGMVMPTR